MKKMLLLPLLGFLLCHTFQLFTAAHQPETYDAAIQEFENLDQARLLAIANSIHATVQPLNKPKLESLVRDLQDTITQASYYTQDRSHTLNLLAHITAISGSLNLLSHNINTGKYGVLEKSIINNITSHISSAKSLLQPLQTEIMNYYHFDQPTDSEESDDSAADDDSVADDE